LLQPIGGKVGRPALPILASAGFCERGAFPAHGKRLAGLTADTARVVIPWRQRASAPRHGSQTAAARPVSMGRDRLGVV